MDSNKFKLVLAMTVLTVPLACTGCGKDVEEVPVDDTQASVESTINTEVNETIEEDLADEGIEVTPTPTPEVEETETLDESAFYVTTLYAVGEICVFAEPSEDAEVIGTIADRVGVSTLGLLHKAEFYKVQYDETTTGYVRVVDLEEESGSYDEETNSELVEETPETDVEEGVTTETGIEETPTPETNNSLPSDSNLGGLTEEEIQDILIQDGFGDPEYIYDPSQDEEFTLGQSGTDTSGGCTIQ